MSLSVNLSVGITHFIRNYNRSGKRDARKRWGGQIAVPISILGRCVPRIMIDEIAGHAEPRTTGFYDRRQKKVTRNIVERISI